jgi:hypothetical protein
MSVMLIRWVLLCDPCRQVDAQDLLCIDAAQELPQISRWLVLRCQIEFTFPEVRDQPDVEARRQWSGKAIARTMPCLLRLLPIVTLLVAHLDGRARIKVPAAPGTADSGRLSPTHRSGAMCHLE